MPFPEGIGMPRQTVLFRVKMVHIVCGSLEDHYLGGTLLRLELWNLVAKLEEARSEVLASPPLQDIMVGPPVAVLGV